MIHGAKIRPAHNGMIASCRLEFTVGRATHAPIRATSPSTAMFARTRAPSPMAHPIAPAVFQFACSVSSANVHRNSARKKLVSPSVRISPEKYNSVGNKSAASSAIFPALSPNRMLAAFMQKYAANIPATPCRNRVASAKRLPNNSIIAARKRG